MRKEVVIMRRLIFAFLALLAGFSFSPQKSYAVEFGLTPSDVVMLWMNTNNALVRIAEIAPGGGAGLSGQVKALTPEIFSNKKPSDVLGQVTTFRSKLDALRKRIGLSATGQYGNGDGKVTPSVVYLNTGFVLDATAEWIIKSSNNSVSAGAFYFPHKVKGKKPSDAFALVELATRRIDLIMARTTR
jgi:hypothetical protein